MPRIRNWKDLTLYRPDNTNKYKHIDEIFSDTINWDLIEKYFPDMLRVALSIKDGKITPSPILKKLGAEKISFIKHLENWEELYELLI